MEEQLMFTEEEFALLDEALSTLPKHQSMGESFGEMLAYGIFENRVADKQKFELEREESKRKAKQKQQLLEDNISLLRAKLILLKRSFRQQSVSPEATTQA